MQKIFPNPTNRKREDAVRPPSDQLGEVAIITHDEACNLARRVKTSKALHNTPNFRNFLAAAVEALGKKTLAIKRIGPNYLPEVGSLLRDLTEVVVDVFWVASYYRDDPEIAEKLSEQFFACKERSYLEQYEMAREIMKGDLFLREFYDPEKWEEEAEDNREKLANLNSLKEWRQITNVISKNQSKWKARSKRAADLVADIANLQSAPYLNNLNKLSAYTHWDSSQLQAFSEEFQQAMFDRYLNISIGFVHDAMNGTCTIGQIPGSIKTKELYQYFLYMST